MNAESNIPAPAAPENPVLLAYSRATSAIIASNGGGWNQADSTAAIMALMRWSAEQLANEPEHAGDWAKLLATHGTLLTYVVNKLANPSAFRQFLEEKGKIVKSATSSRAPKVDLAKLL